MCRKSRHPPVPSGTRAGPRSLATLVSSPAMTAGLKRRRVMRVMREKWIILAAACAAASLLAASAPAQIALPPASKAWGFNASPHRLNVPAGEDPSELVLDAAEAAGATHMRFGIH